MPNMADTSTTPHKIAAEVLGTFVLVFLGCGSVIYNGTGNGDFDIVSVGLTFGLAVMVMAYAVGRISGAHFNPAVSVGAALGGRMSWRQVPLYVGAQLAGAIVAGLALFVLMQGYEVFEAEGNMGQNSFGDEGSGYAWWAAFLLEVLITFLFVTVILAVTDGRFEHPALAPLAIGLTLTAIHFVAIPATGTSANPARSIGPALFAGTDAILQLWLFILAPLIGGALGGFAYPLLFGRDTEPVAGSGWRFARRAPAAAVPGYGAPDQFQQEWNQQAVAEQTAWEQEPIIQDGWQWDHAAQEWKPLEQWQPAAPAQTQVPGQTQSASQPEPTRIVDPTHQPATTDPAVSPHEQPPQ